MAAQKLTKGRFVQIITMLTVLISAFFWRTFTYEEPKKVTCKLQQSCAFYVNDAQFLAQFNLEVIKVVTPNDSWEINDGIKIDTANNTWQLNDSSLRVIELMNSKSNESMKINFVVLENN
ncbi:hypothetical protein VII00023_00485 [Vibrio ichthyoenteri ATCC 700023]|uniref:Uncharacterized protein n=1 Tax=Vibrio ichthyoenteri ATCC 700023 TaxID=870968 RepID=F9RXI4_9VIBR|nr:hypothetical protein [Vibrio ichthyoenteri]EGU47993.1 hypothetical protein VII00023_00485 [Vibrio ichthyoenteri ATCC 700023]